MSNIIIALPLEEKLLTPLHAWGKRFDWSHVTGVHFTHVVKKNVTPLEFGLMEMPDAATFNSMSPTLERFLREEAQKILPASFKQEVYFNLSCDFNPEEEVLSLIKKTGADLLVVTTLGRHGFPGIFHSSFTEHMIRYAPCDVYVVRPAHS